MHVLMAHAWRDGVLLSWCDAGAKFVGSQTEFGPFNASTTQPVLCNAETRNLLSGYAEFMDKVDCKQAASQVGLAW